MMQSDSQSGAQLAEQPGTAELLDAAEVEKRLRKKRPADLGYLAMFSSYLNGVITDPALMSLPLDDHMVHRGHGVFDTATLSGGQIYRLRTHIDRLLTSAELARIKHPWTQDDFIKMVVNTAAVAGVRDGAIRYWLSAGPGGFSFSPAECEEPCFYCIIFEPRPLLSVNANPSATGVSEATIIDTPMKPALLAATKSNNYLLNVLTHLEALDRGGTFGILVDDGGLLAESCVLNVCLLSADGVLSTPPFDGILAGTTVRRVLELCESQLVPQGLIKEAVMRPINAAQVKRDGIAEMFLCGGDTHVFPINSWDGVPIGDSQPGPVTRRIQQLLSEDATAADSGDLIAVPYA